MKHDRRNKNGQYAASPTHEDDLMIPCKRHGLTGFHNCNGETKMTVEINHSRYVRSHGTQPRGRGLWLFETPVGRVCVSHNGSLSEAKKVAKEYAKKIDLRLLFVCP